MAPQRSTCRIQMLRLQPLWSGRAPANAAHPPLFLRYAAQTSLLRVSLSARDTDRTQVYKSLPCNTLFFF